MDGIFFKEFSCLVCLGNSNNFADPTTWFDSYSLRGDQIERSMKKHLVSNEGMSEYSFFQVPLSRYEPNKYVNYAKQAETLEIVKKR